LKDYTPLFEASKGEPIMQDGSVLHRRCWIDVAGGDTLVLRFLSFTTEYIQGLRISAEQCQLTVERFTGKEIVLWTDSAPEQVRLEVVKSKKRARVGFLNVWKDREHETMMYALTSSAMRVSRTDDGELVLRCSDGSGEPEFDDLVVQIRRDQS
jgi:hypothetical protein